MSLNIGLVHLSRVPPSVLVTPLQKKNHPICKSEE